MRRLLSFAGAFALMAIVAAPSASEAQQAVTFSVGGFVPRGENSRDLDDVLFNNLNAGSDSLLFNVSDFNGPTVNGEWVFGLNEFIDASLGVGFYSKSVPSIYADLVNSNGREIEQDLKLRVVPFTATVRFLPIGRRDGIIPYVGAGVGVMRFRYEESGQFVNTQNNVFNGTFTGTGSATGPVILGGVRFPIGGIDIGGEARYQRALGDISKEDNFLGTKIDLGGMSYLATFTVKF